MLKSAFLRLIPTVLIILLGLVVFFNLKPSEAPEKPSNSPPVVPNRTADTIKTLQIPQTTRQESQQDMQDAEENSVLRPLPLNKIPGGGIVLSKEAILDAPAGAEALADVLADDNITDEKKAETLARMAMNLKEDIEVRQEALDQWLRFIPQEGETLLSTLANDPRITNEMAAILIKDTFTRTVTIQAEVALVLFNHKELEIRRLAHEQLIALTGNDHKENKDAWVAEVKNLLSRQPKN